MKTQEVNFKCRNCNNEVEYLRPHCQYCAFIIEWEETVSLDYEDKYLQIFTVHV